MYFAPEIALPKNQAKLGTLPLALGTASREIRTGKHAAGPRSPEKRRA